MAPVQDMMGKPTEAGAAAFIAAVAFDADGLVPAVAQQHDTGEILMVAWMNRDAIAETIATGRVCYWSRSRGRLWRKGETSGQTQRLVDLRVDCDGDTLVVLVDQDGVACHTGRRNCFFRALRGDTLETIAEPQVSPSVLYGEPASD
jgi:phosphoribosyl-AMP cyclohydrolase